MPKILIERAAEFWWKRPPIWGALQAYTPMEPTVVSVASDDEGVDPTDLRAKSGSGADAARFVYLLPNFQNPTGRTMTEARRAAVAAVAADVGLPIIEDNPYGDLWFDAPPPASLSSRNPDGSVYLGSFPKFLPLACAWVTWWPPKRCTPSCFRPNRRPTCTRPAQPAHRGRGAERRLH